MPLKNQPNEFEVRHWQQFQGKTIIQVELIDIGEFLLPTFTFNDGTFAQLWQDPEGNGPGWMGRYDLKTGNEISLSPS